jgi:hypothetical protein
MLPLRVLAADWRHQSQPTKERRFIGKSEDLKQRHETAASCPTRRLRVTQEEGIGS